MGFDRNKYKGTSVSAMNQKEQEVNVKLPTNSSYADYHKIEEGKNLFRVYPKKETEDTYIYPKVVSWLQVPVEEEIEIESGPQKGQKKKVTNWKKKPIFNAKVHGNFKDDPCECFLRIARKLVSDKYQGYQPDDEDLQKGINSDVKKINSVLWPIENWKDGLSPSKSWVFYADKYSQQDPNSAKNFGRVEIWDTIYNDMKKQAAAQEDASSGFIDPFSDPDKGKLLIITKEVTVAQNNKKKTSYDLSIEMWKDWTISDKDLEKFEDYPALSKQFENCYSKSDFEKTVAGLEKIDKDHGFGVFQTDEFLDILEEISNMLPEESEDQDETATPNYQVKEQSPMTQTVQQQSDETLEVDDMNRKQLKAFIKENNLGIVVKSTMDDEVLKELIHESLEAKNQKDNAPIQEEDNDEDDIARIREGKPSDDSEEEDDEGQSMMNKYLNK